MSRFMASFAFAALAIVLALAPVRGEMAAFEPVALETRSAARALDAIPAIFAISQNYEGVDFDVDGLVESLVALENYGPAQEQLSAAVSVYDFSGYSDWLATIRTIFTTYAYARSDAAKAAVETAAGQIADDPSVTQAQKDAILAELENPAAAPVGEAAVDPSQENLRVVVALSPQIASAIETMQAMR